jgi:ADP-heptose:LPS heptosyltransferase
MVPEGEGILLVKLGPIGDVVMASPILEAASRIFPGKPVTWLVTASLAPRR